MGQLVDTAESAERRAQLTWHALVAAIVLGAALLVRAWQKVVEWRES